MKQKLTNEELAKKIWDSIEMKMLGDKLAKEGTLHQMKKLKAQIGKLRKNYDGFGRAQFALDEVISIIDKKIALDKINQLTKQKMATNE